MDFPPPLSQEWTLAPGYVSLSTARPVQMLRHEAAVSFRRHSHAYTELVLVQGGSILHEVFEDGAPPSRVEVTSGDFLIVPPGTSHGYSALAGKPECRRVDICYLAEWFLWDMDALWAEGLVPLFFAAQLFRRRDGLRIGKLRLSPEEAESCERELRDIEAEYSRAQPSLLYVRSTFFRLLVGVARAWRRQIPQGEGQAHPEMHPEMHAELWGALQSIDLCLREGRLPSVEALARGAGLSPKSFARRFQAATGLCAREYLGQRRAQHAAHLLLESELSIGEVASRLGYYDASHLSRAFVRSRGLSPRAFRARFRIPEGPHSRGE